MEWGSFATESLPIVAVVMEEVSDLTEDFEQDSVSEWHGGGCLDNFGGVLLIGGKGVVFFGGFFVVFSGWGFVFSLLECGGWFFCVRGFIFCFSCVQDRKLGGSSGVFLRVIF